MSFPIISFGGTKGSGKNTAARLLRELRPELKIYETSFSAPLKKLVGDSYQIPDRVLYGDSNLRDTWEIGSYFQMGNFKVAQSMGIGFCAASQVEISPPHKALRSLNETSTARQVLQVVGTEVGRYIDPNIWCEAAINDCKSKLSSGEYDLAVITDQRFRNELLALNSIGATTVKLERSLVSGPEDLHQSEKEFTSIPDWWFSYVILNNLGLDRLKVGVSAMVVWALGPK